MNLKYSLLFGYILPCLMVVTPTANGEEIVAFTEPYRDVDIAAPEMGTLELVEVKEGQKVTAGQVLARLNDDVLQASLKMAKAGMESQGRLNSAIGELKMQADRFQKIVGLRARKHASQQEVDRTRAQKEIAEAQVQAVKDDLNVKSVEYERIQAQLQLRRVKSPIDGVVTVVYKDAGEFVSATDPTVVKVVQLDPLLVVFSVPMSTAQSLKTNESVSLVLGNEESIHRTGTIEFVSPTSDAQSGTTRVKVRVPNSDRKLLSGMNCRLLLEAEEQSVADKSDLNDSDSFKTKPVTKKRKIVPKRQKQNND